MDTHSDPKAVPRNPRKEARFLEGSYTCAKAHSGRQSATHGPRRLVRTSEKLAVRQSQRRTPGRLSRRPGNTGCSNRLSPARRRAQPGPAWHISIPVPSDERTPDSWRALLPELVSVGSRASQVCETSQQKRESLEQSSWIQAPLASTSLRA